MATVKYKCVGVVMLSALLGACQWAGPIFVDYNGVRRDVAEWINGQNLLSMQQKRSLAQLSRAEQPLLHADKAEDPATRLALAKSHQEAMHCAYLVLPAEKIDQLQEQVWGADKARVLADYQQHFPKLKLDASSIQCD